MEKQISKQILSSFFEKLENCLQLDAAIVGAGPSGLVAAYYIAKAGYKTAVFESKLAPGGGMWGGAMMFNQIVVQEEAKSILDELDVVYETSIEGTYILDSVHSTSALIYKATQAGAEIFNNIYVEDVIFKNSVVQGLVINWSPVTRSKMHVDPMMISSKAVLDGTGHPCEIASLVARKNNVKLATETGSVIGEKSLDVIKGEETTVENTKQIYPGLFVSGMAANGVSGSFRMGPIFGGMLLSGKKVAGLIIEVINHG